MKVPPNLLRSQVEDFEHTTARLSPKQLERRDRILNVGTHLLALHGLRSLRICDLALAMNLTSAAIRTHFADLDALLIHILRRHLQAIDKALCAILQSDPHAIVKRRAAYFAATRFPSGSLTDAHLLLVRDAAMLSEANLAAIQESHDQHGIILAGTLDADTALTLLDAPRLDPLRIQASLATLEGSDPARLAPLPVPSDREVKQPVPQPPLSEPAWSGDLADLADDLLQTCLESQTPGAWVFNPGHARAPPRAA